MGLISNWSLLAYRDAELMGDWSLPGYTGLGASPWCPPFLLQLQKILPVLEGRGGRGSSTWGLYPELWFMECWAQGQPLIDRSSSSLKWGSSAPGWAS